MDRAMPTWKLVSYSAALSALPFLGRARGAPRLLVDPRTRLTFSAVTT